MTISGQEPKLSKQKKNKQKKTICHPVSKPFILFIIILVHFNKSLYTVQSKLQSFVPTAWGKTVDNLLHLKYNKTSDSSD